MMGNPGLNVPCIAQRGQSSSTEVRLKVATSAAVTPEINNAVYYRSLNVGLSSS